MKTKQLLTFAKRVLLTSVFLLCGSLAAASTAVAEDEVAVQVESTKLRSAPQHWANGVAALSYGTRLVLLEGGTEGWLKVRASGNRVGFVHKSSVNSSKVVLSASSQPGLDGGSSSVILAGKGFSPEVERQYAAVTQGVNFSAVNRMERVIVSEADVVSFRRTGRLNG